MYTVKSNFNILYVYCKACADCSQEEKHCGGLICQVGVMQAEMKSHQEGQGYWH